MSDAIGGAQKRRYEWRHGAHTYSRINNCSQTARIDSSQ